MQYALIKSALSLIEFEKKLIYLQLKYPGVRDAQSKRRHSPLKISKKYTNSDLMELIAPLSAAGFFCLYDDTPASFMQIVREFEIMCNTRIKNPDNSRWSILNRKNKLTHFLDILRNTLIELSRKYLVPAICGPRRTICTDIRFYPYLPGLNNKVHATGR